MPSKEVLFPERTQVGVGGEDDGFPGGPLESQVPSDSTVAQNDSAGQSTGWALKGWGLVSPGTISEGAGEGLEGAPRREMRKGEQEVLREKSGRQARALLQQNLGNCVHWAVPSLRGGPDSLLTSHGGLHPKGPGTTV